MQLLLFPNETEVCYVFSPLSVSACYHVSSKSYRCGSSVISFPGRWRVSMVLDTCLVIEKKKVAAPDTRSNMWQVMNSAAKHIRCFVTPDSHLGNKQILA